MLETALAYLAAGRSIVPIAPGCKRPSLVTEWGEIIDLPWTPFQHKRPSKDYVQKWFTTEKPMGIGIIGGSVSGAARAVIRGLEFLDIDDPEIVPDFFEQAHYHGLADALKHLPTERTPRGGVHIGYLCQRWEGNQVLAQRMVDGKPVTLIEIRGRGGLCVVAPTPVGIHPKFPERGYELIRGSWTNVQVITKDERDVLFDVARGMTEIVKTKTFAPQAIPKSDRPGDKLNATADSVWWSDLLTKHGWKRSHEKGGVEYWQRPGKEGKEWSATLGKCGQYFYVFSSNAAPFEANRAYTPFAALTLLEHNGDYSETTHSLKGQAMADRKYQKQIGVLWLKESKRNDGSTLRYFSGYIDNGIHGDIPIVIFRVQNKNSENGPDYNIVLSQPAPQQAQQKEEPEENPDDDIPF